MIHYQSLHSDKGTPTECFTAHTHVSLSTTRNKGARFLAPFERRAAARQRAVTLRAHVHLRQRVHGRQQGCRSTSPAVWRRWQWQSLGHCLSMAAAGGRKCGQNRPRAALTEDTSEALHAADGRWRYRRKIDGAAIAPPAE